MGGHGALLRFVAEVEDVLGDVDIEATERRGHAIDLARRACREGRGAVVAVGGDGTLNEVVNGVLLAREPEFPESPSRGVPPQAATSPRVGLIGLGTGGDFGHSLGIGRSLSDYLAVIAAGHVREIDLMRARFTGHDGGPAERYVVNVLSAGPGGLVDRYVAGYPRFVGGRLAYALASVRALIECPKARLRLVARGVPSAASEASTGADLSATAMAGAGDLEREVATYLLAVCNGIAFGGGMRMAPMAVPDDGLLEVMSVSTANKRTVLANMPKVYRGEHLEVPGVEHFSCRGLDVELLDARAAERFALDVDGEALGRLPLSIEVMPKALAVFAPPPPRTAPVTPPVAAANR